MVKFVNIYICPKIVYNNSDCKKNRRGSLKDQIYVQFVTNVYFTTLSG
jgi:hypothetical protein